MLFYSAYSQENKPKELPFEQVLSIIEKRHEVSFSYADETIKNKSVSVPSNSLSLPETLLFIEERLKLNFEILNDRFIVVKKRKEFQRQPKPKLQKLREVVLTGYLASGISKKLDGAIEVETEKLGVLPGLIEPDVFQTVKAMPGVVSTDESISSLNIRGGSND